MTQEEEKGHVKIIPTPKRGIIKGGKTPKELGL